MGRAAPVLQDEMTDYVKLGGVNLGIVPDDNHGYGFHMAANQIGPEDYSRANDPNGPWGPYASWDFCCAADFGHNNDPRLLAYHVAILARLMRGEMPSICEFIGKPWPDKPVVYWARWNGITTLQRYDGSGHDRWSHIAIYRSMAADYAHRPWLWSLGTTTPAPLTTSKRSWPSYMGPNDYFGLITGPEASHGGYYSNERADIQAIQQQLIRGGYVPGITDPNDGWADGVFEQPTKEAVANWQRANYPELTTRYGEVWSDDWSRLFQ